MGKITKVDDPENVKPKWLFWKGKHVSQRVYNNRLRQREAGKNIRKVYGTKNAFHNLQSDVNSRFIDIEGRRIMHFQTLADELICKKCNTVLSLKDTVHEKHHGLASIFYVECRVCKVMCEVKTDKQHSTSDGQHKHFDCNTKAVMGIINSGDGNTDLNKFLAGLNIPNMNWKTFKTHEREVGKEAEKMADDSCRRAALEERQKTIENFEELKKLLPDHLKTDFIFPDLSGDPKDIAVSVENLVRIAASFDMGWNTRGNGRNYDSLSGTGAFMGKLCKKVIARITLNRKCRKCDLGHPKTDHDCRLNFEGSAKAMEAGAASVLINNNSIFKDCNIQLGIVIADNDSSSYCAIRNATNHEVVKQSDKNHTSKGVSNHLYKIKNDHKELSVTSIKYLKKCFNYCISQNQGNSISLEAAIRNIPYHCFNEHDNCGPWCSYSSNPEEYKHTNIGDGFKDANLFSALKTLFNDLANNANRFSGGASSNPNESLNAGIAAKVPKSRLYGTSAAGDIRVACAINKKNDGEKYVVDLATRLNVSPGKYIEEYCQKTDAYSRKRYVKSCTVDFKKRRLFLAKKKTELKNKKELSEGTTYGSNIGLLGILDEPMPLAIIDANLKPIVVLFDLETGSLRHTADILQIAARYEEKEFAVYIKPTQKIDDTASAINGLKVIHGQLHHFKDPVITVTLAEAMRAFYEFLLSFQRKCVLAAHNCKFDYPRLMLAMKKVFMRENFKSVVEGFCDTLPIISKVNKTKGKGPNKLETLARSLYISIQGAHDATVDVMMLQEVLLELGISFADLMKSVLTWSDVGQKEIFYENLPTALEELKILNQCTSLVIRKKIVAAGITLGMIKDSFTENKFNGLKKLFGNESNIVTKHSTVIKKICDFLEKLPKNE